MTTYMSRFYGKLAEDSPLEAPVGGFNRHAKLMSPGTRELVLKARATEIEAFAEDRGYNPAVIAGIAEASMRLGRVPELRQYGFAGDDAKAIKHFMAGEILNIAIEEILRAQDAEWDAVNGIDEKSPEGWKGSVEAMKTHKDIDNPYALAHSMKKKGAEPHYKEPEKKGAKPQLKKKFAKEKTMEDVRKVADLERLAEDDLDESTGSGNVGGGFMQLGTAFIQRPRTLMDWNKWEETGEEQAALNMGPSVGVDVLQRTGYTINDMLRMGEDELADVVEGKKKKGDVIAKGVTPPADVEPGEFDHASGGTAPGKPRKIRIEGKTRAQRKKENKARFAKLSPAAKAATKGDAPFHPEAGKEDVQLGASVLRESAGTVRIEGKKKLHPSMKKHTNAPHFKAHVGDSDDSEPPYHKGKGIQQEGRKAKLSKILKKLSKKNAPPGGWSDADLVKPKK